MLLSFLISLCVITICFIIFMQGEHFYFSKSPVWGMQQRNFVILACLVADTCCVYWEVLGNAWHFCSCLSNLFGVERSQIKNILTYRFLHLLFGMIRIEFCTDIQGVPWITRLIQSLEHIARRFCTYIHDSLPVFTEPPSSVWFLIKNLLIWFTFRIPLFW